MEKMVQERKLSKKINYDVLKDLNPSAFKADTIEYPPVIIKVMMMMITVIVMLVLIIIIVMTVLLTPGRASVSVHFILMDIFYISLGLLIAALVLLIQ